MMKQIPAAVTPLLTRTRTLERFRTVSSFMVNSLAYQRCRYSSRLDAIFRCIHWPTSVFGTVLTQSDVSFWWIL